MDRPSHRQLESLDQWIPDEIGEIKDHQKDLPRIAKDRRLTEAIEANLPQIPTVHQLVNADGRNLTFLPDSSIHLVVTSPPYWSLKRYRESSEQLGHIQDYDQFLAELRKVWEECYRVLVPGGRLVCVVGDVCLSRRKNHGEHTVIPLHSSIQEQCRLLGYSNLAPIIWSKISNVKHEAARNGGGFLGKPFEPNGVIKHDIEFILMLRKPGGYRKPTLTTRILSAVPEAKHREWFQQIWTDVPGESTRNHPAPFPEELAQRLVRMFSFVGDTVLDPFLGSGTTSIAAARWGRNSIGIEIDPEYHRSAVRRIEMESSGFLSGAKIVE